MEFRETQSDAFAGENGGDIFHWIGRRPCVEDRLPPADFDSEQAVIGSILLEGVDAANIAFGIVKPDEFYRTYHKQIASAMFDVLERGEPVDLVTVSAELRRLGQLDEVGGGEYLTALIGEVPTAAHVRRYANIVTEKALLRRLAAEGAKIQDEALANPENVGAALATATERLKQLQERMVGASVFSPKDSYERDVDEAWDEWRKPRPKISAARLGIDEADQKMGGLQAHSLLVIKASKKDGKSQLLRQAAIESAKAFVAEGRGRHVLFFGLEERWKVWRSFAWAYLAGLDSKEFTLQGWMKKYLEERPQDRKRVTAAQAELSALPIRCCFGVRDWGQISAACRSESMRYHVGLVVVDYFQKLRGGVEEKYSSEEYAYRKRAESMVELGVELDVPVVTGSQVTWNRDLKQFTSKGASAIEEEAFTVLEWKREREKVTNIAADTGTLNCVTARLGTGFRPIQVVTDMKSGHYWDYDQHQRLKSDERMASGLAAEDGSSEEYQDPFQN